MQRRLAAILAADVVGYSSLMGQDEVGTLDRLKALHRDLVRPAIKERKGRIVKLMGDGLLAEFASAVEAVRCAADIQLSMRKREGHLEPAKRVTLRIGVNLGDIIVEGEDIFGDGVNVAARLESLSDPGGVCISGQAFDVIDGKLGLSFHDAGLQTVKNITKPVRTYKLDLGGPSEASIAPPAAPKRPGKSIAVLPFVNMSGDAEQDYFSDGITEDIITELSRFRQLFVIARNSSFAFKGKQIEPNSIGRALGTQYLVEGSLRRSGDMVRITAQLIETETGAQIWAERYDRKLDDIFAVQDEVVAKIATAVPGVLDAAATRQVQRHKADNPTAYEFLLRAIHLRRQDWGAREALPLLEKVIVADPHCANAYAHLASWHAYSILAYGADYEAARKTALDMAKKANELDPNDAEVLSVIAEAYLVTGDLSMSRKSLEKAIKNNPNSYVVMSNAGTIFAYLGEADRAIEWLNKFSQHDPISIETMREDAQVINYLARRFQESVNCFTGFSTPPIHLIPDAAAAYAQLGEIEKAATLREIYESQDDTGEMFAKLLATQMRMCATPALRELLLDGFRKAGFQC